MLIVVLRVFCRKHRKDESFPRDELENKSCMLTGTPRRRLFNLISFIPNEAL